MSIESYPFASGNVEKPMMVYKEQIPQDLLSYPQWVCWRYVDCGAGKKPTKQPINPRTLHNAGVNWPNTWTSFEQAYTTYVQHAFSVKSRKECPQNRSLKSPLFNGLDVH